MLLCNTLVSGLSAAILYQSTGALAGSTSHNSDVEEMQNVQRRGATQFADVTAALEGLQISTSPCAAKLQSVAMESWPKLTMTQSSSVAKIWLEKLGTCPGTKLTVTQLWNAVNLSIKGKNKAKAGDDVLARAAKLPASASAAGSKGGEKDVASKSGTADVKGADTKGDTAGGKGDDKAKTGEKPKAGGDKPKTSDSSSASGKSR
ncbi:hypothetical protein ANO11243_080980 [Dothideomycetidae sp. 11243]|nr:hypothetical protein ANO11243_080980 [fungal sp. No.11243]